MKTRKRLSIRSRLVLIMIALALVPVATLTWIAAENTLKSVEQEIIDATMTRVNWAGQYMEEILFQLNDLFYSLQLNQHIISAVNNPEYRDFAFRSSDTVNLQTTLTSAYFDHSRIIKELSLYLHRSGVEITIDAVRSGEIDYPIIAIGKWSPLLSGPVSLQLDKRDGVIYGVHSINTFEDRQLKGGIGVILHSQVVRDLTTILNGRGKVYILNHMGQPLVGDLPGGYGQDLSVWIGDGFSYSSVTRMMRTDTQLIFSRTVDRGRVTILTTLPLSLIQESARPVLFSGLFISGFLMIGSGILAVLFTLWFSKPIIHLARTMEQASLVDFTHLKVESQDEIGLLSEGYNSLMIRMKDLVEKEYQGELELRNARLNALHAQINPHFLHNTLQLIGGMAVAKDVPEIYRVSRAVGDLFRYTTASEGQLVTLDKELEHIQNYLLIQEMRYKGRCTYTMDIDPVVHSCPIPRFTLQPLLENAFEHGLQKKPGNWTLGISAKMQKNGVLVSIKDSGIGMDYQQLKIQRGLLSPGKVIGVPGDSHIGLRNVDSRLRMHFGSSYRLFLFSVKSRGTVAALKLPMTVQGEAYGV